MKEKSVELKIYDEGEEDLYDEEEDEDEPLSDDDEDEEDASQGEEEDLSAKMGDMKLEE